MHGRQSFILRGFTLTDWVISPVATKTKCISARRENGPTGLRATPASTRNLMCSSSSVLLAAGDRGKAETIQFAGREAERHRESNWLTWAWLTVLAFIAGYGIVLYTFFVLGWVLLITAIGAALLRLSPQARAHGFWWRFGASLHRVLPVIELSKDFTSFFDGLPQERIFPRWRKRLLEVYFAGHAIAGYVLGFILVAALGGITQK
jgi:hypothetical protein